MDTVALPAFAKALSGEIVEIFVGPEEKVFRVHKQVICKFELFEGMFNGVFQEAQLGKVCLPEDDPLAFVIFLHWAYGNKIDEIREEESIFLKVKAYCLASKYMITELMNILMEKIHWDVETDPNSLSEFAIDYFYRNCAMDCGLKRFFAEACVTTLRWDSDSCFGPISVDSLVKLTRDHEDLQRGIFSSLRDDQYGTSDPPWTVAVDNWYD